jgi:hypothetical protein
MIEELFVDFLMIYCLIKAQCALSLPAYHINNHPKIGARMKKAVKH